VTRPWSLRRRLVVSSVLSTLITLGIVGIVGLLAERHQISINLLNHALLLGGICVLGAVVGIVQLRLGLSPFERLRAQLQAVRDGRTRAVTGDYPAEVQPLVDDLNALLDQRDQAIHRAQRQAADLAHGLKTPLAIIAHESTRAASAGAPEFSAAVDQEIGRMRRQITYHLAHARAAASGATLGARTNVRESVEGLGRALARLHAGRGVAIDVNLDGMLAVRCHREDLDEMLGNLLDNACTWARSRVVVSARAGDTAVEITVDDDGAGLEVSMREAVLQRGVRADEAAPGTGLGLAIVRDLVELYGGSITLTTSPMAGLRATLRLPDASR
jgi:signal transduction histidine kinase